MPNTSLIYLSSQRLAAVEVVGPYEETVQKAWDLMFEWLTRSQNHASHGRGYGLALDDPRLVPPGQCRFLAGVAVPERWHPGDLNLVSLHTFSGGAYAWRQHRGNYSGMGAAIAGVRAEQLPRQGLQLDGTRPVVTIYYDDPRIVPRESQVADVCVPVIASFDAMRRTG